jgi:GNAT superfamily N-acetyltransferase
MNSEFQINTKPSIENLNEIKFWLSEEYEKTEQGFYCNWNVIEKGFKNNELIIFHNEISIIGFVIWASCEIYALIDILEINPNFRKRGFGKLFYEKIAEYYISKDLLAIKLFCSPIESEKFWKKMGFIKFPNRGYSESDLTYFKPLIEINFPLENGNFDNKLELWDLEPYQVENQKPKWTWKIEKENSEFSKPIIHPSNSNWNLRWTKNNKIIKEDKIKYFAKKNNPIDFSPFLYIKELN